MTGTGYKDLDNVPDAVATTMATMTTNAVHLATLLAEALHPPT